MTKACSENVLAFWAKNRSNFHTLSVLTTAVFGAPSSASEIEGDFGEVGRMITGCRTGLSSQYIKAVQVLKRNTKLLNLAQFDRLNLTNVANYLPSSALKNALDPEDEELSDDEDICYELSALENLTISDEF